MNDDRIIRYITRQLDEATKTIGGPVLDRLLESRRKALLSRSTTSVMRLSSSIGAVGGDHHHHHHPSFLFKWGSALLLISAFTIGGIHYWQQQMDQDEEIGQLDANLLAGDIAPQDLSSQEFGSWLSENP